MKRSLSSLLAGAVSVLGTSYSAEAVLVTNTTLGQTLFDSAGFESDTVGQVPSAAAVGTWNSAGLPHDIVTNAASPGPIGGSKYLKTVRDSFDSGNPQAIFLSNQATNGENIHMEWHMWSPFNGDEAVILHNGTNTYRGLLRVTGGQVQYYNGSAFINSNAVYTRNQWQKFEIDYAIGASDFSIQVNDTSNGVATALNGLSTLGGGDLDALWFGHNSGTTYYIDAAPPASLPGDFNNDQVVNASDIDLLCDAITGGGSTNPYDVNGDNSVNMADLIHHVRTILGTDFGDTDTDGDVDLNDLGNLATNYEQSPPRGWAQGDFDCDGDVDLNDLGTLATYYGLGEAQAMADFAQLVPEPGSVGLLALAGIAIARRRR